MTKEETGGGGLGQKTAAGMVGKKSLFWTGRRGKGGGPSGGGVWKRKKEGDWGTLTDKKTAGKKGGGPGGQEGTQKPQNGNNWAVGGCHRKLPGRQGEGGDPGRGGDHK